ncbi:MAG: polysaccharide deacetylase family protein [Terriglobales bacterium]
MATSALTPPPPRALLLMYHSIGEVCPPGGERFAVSAAAFLDQLRLLDRLRRSGAITVVDLGAWWRGSASAGPAPVALCFDDGWGSDWEQALPRLQEFGFTATFFLSTALVGQPGYLEWPQVRALAEAGMNIACHGHEHVPLCRVPPARLQAQLHRARQTLQAWSGAPVPFLAAPFGLWNRRVLEAALGAGFRALATSRPGRAAAGAPCLPRNAVYRATPARQLQTWLEGRPGSLAVRLGRHGILWLPKYIRLRIQPKWLPAAPPAVASRSLY